MFREIEDHIKSYPFFAFIKGSPDAPKCKFTRKLVDMFKEGQYKYKTLDILQDERIRSWMKFYSNWPTFPQVFLNGELVGGVDIVTDLIDSGEFSAMVPASCKALSPLEAFQALLASNPVVALLDGTVESPSTQPSIDFVALLKRHGIQFVAVDAISNPDLLAKLALDGGFFPGVPSLFVKGTSVGTLETLLDLEAKQTLT